MSEPKLTDYERTRPRALTKSELSWVRLLGSVMKACPDTLDLMTTGGDLVVLDRKLARSGPIHDGFSERRGADLAMIPGNCLVHGVSG